MISLANSPVVHGRLDAAAHDPLLPDWILASDYLGQQAQRLSASTGIGWKC
jgi:hypothetical protein